MFRGKSQGIRENLPERFFLGGICYRGCDMVPIGPDLGKLLHDHEHIANVVMFESLQSRHGILHGDDRHGRRIGIVVVVSERILEDEIFKKFKNLN